MAQHSATMTFEELKAVIAEAAPHLEGRRVLRFRALRPDQYMLSLKSDEGARPPHLCLFISLTPGLNYMHIARFNGNRDAPPESGHKTKTGEATDGSDFVRYVDSAVSGSRFAALTISGANRIVTLSFEKENVAFLIRVELFGRHPNMIVLDGEGLVIEALRKRPYGSRPIVPGKPVPPVRQTKGFPETERKPAAPGGNIRFSPLDEATPATLPWNEAAHIFFKELECQRALEELRSSIKKGLARRLKTTQKKIFDSKKKIALAERAGEIREQGDLLKAHFHLLRRGMDRIEIPGDQNVIIRLDPSLSPVANLEKIYKRYKKTKKSLTPLREMLCRLEEKLTELSSVGNELNRADSRSDLETLAERLKLQNRRPGRTARGAGSGEKGPLKSKPLSKPKKAKSMQGVRRFLSPEGLTIFVGRDGEVNHRLTFRIARGNDLWMHCHNAPGSHVIISLPKNRTASLDTIKSAGLLAVHFSKLRGAGRADVTYTQRKYVRPVKGAKKGTVLVERSKTLHIKASSERLGLLLDSMVTD